MIKCKGTIKDRIETSISQYEGEVLFPADFRAMGSQSQIGRALRRLIEEGKIFRLGHGVYAKARPSVLSGKPIPRATLEELAQETLGKWHIPVRVGSAQANYAVGLTDQVPVHAAFYTGKHRITRKITLGATTVRFENDYDSDK